jgi:WD40 repeat protein/tRNA A-37 threonylcarbamoyl transferase component Bud32
VPTQLNVNCPHCGVLIRENESPILDRVRCPFCRQSFSIASLQRADCAPGIDSDPHAADTFAVDPQQTTDFDPKSEPATKGDAGLSRVGRFELKRLRGRGGFGRVYEAYDTQLKRPVALKLPIFESDDQISIRRFIAEAEAAANLHHPNIVPIYDSGQIDGQSFIAAKWIEGRTLRELVQQNLPEFRVAAGWIEKLAGALAYAHRNGVIHRDIKPANIMLGSDGEPQIMDFGLAKRLNDDAGMTTDGSILGTPAYMSPEQAWGRTKEIEASTDQYSLGCVLYSLLCGKRPFEGPISEVLAKVREIEPVAPRTYRKAIPRDLQTICLKAMSKERSKRYPDCQRLADDLSRWLRGEPIRARRASSTEHFLRWCRRKPLIAAMGAAVVLVLALGSIISLRFAAIANKQAAAAIAAADKERDARKQADDANQSVQRHLYGTRINLAQNAWKVGNVELARENLQGYAEGSGIEELRGFEWYYLQRLCSDKDAIFGNSPIRDLAYTQDGKRLMVAHTVGIDVYDATTRSFSTPLNRIYKGIESALDCLDVSRDGTRIAGAVYFAGAAIWDAATGELLLELDSRKGDQTAPRRRCMSVAFSPDGTYLATAGSEKVVKVWDTQTGDQRLTLSGHTGPILSVAFSPDGTHIASSAGSDGEAKSNDHTVRLWDAATGTELAKLDRHTGDVDRVVFSPDGKRLASASKDQTVRIWDVRSGNELATVGPHRGPVTGVHFSPDGSRLASSSGDALRVSSAATGEQVFTLKSRSAGIQSIAFSPDGTCMVSGNSVGWIETWDAKTGREPSKLIGHSGPVHHIVLSADARRIASIGDDDTLRVWDTATGSVIAMAKVEERDGIVYSIDRATGERVPMGDQPPRGVKQLAISTDGNVVASTGPYSQLRVWDAKTIQLSYELGPSYESTFQGTGPPKKVFAVAFSPNSELLATNAENGDIDVWSLRERKRLFTLADETGLHFYPPHDSQKRVAFSTDGKLLAAAKAANSVTVWEIQNGKKKLSFSAQLGLHEPLIDLRFILENRVLTGVSSNLTVGNWDMGWDAKTGQQKSRSTRLTLATFRAAALSPDGRRVAAGGTDGAITIWDAIAGQELMRLEAHSGQVNSVAFSDDGFHLASAGDDGVIRFWDASVVSKQ